MAAHFGNGWMFLTIPHSIKPRTCAARKQQDDPAPRPAVA
jgi:hypothetical protein